MSYFKPSNPFRGTPATFLLDTVGDGSGATNANGNYSVTPQNFRRNIPNGFNYALIRITTVLGVSSPMTINGYGNIVAALTNGLLFNGQINGSSFSNTGSVVRTNAEFAVRSTSTDVFQLTANDFMFQAYQDLSQFGNGPIILRGNLGDFVQYTLNDNFSTLAQQRFSLTGLLYRA